MDWLNAALAVIAGFTLRFGLPLAITVLIIWWMRRMDEHWKEQAERELEAAGLLRAQARNTGCWDVHNCSPEQRAKCPAYADPDRPCWQVYRQPDGGLQERCLLCQVFRHAPVPA